MSGAGNIIAMHLTFYEQLEGVSRKVEDAYPTGAPDPCSQFLVEPQLLICFCYFVCMILVTLCCLLCICFPCLVFVPGLHSFDYSINLGPFDYSLSP